MQRHLISAADLTRDDAVLILDTAEEMARVADRPIKKLPTLRGRTIVNLFFEDSTRTRISFEAAEKRLSADVINFSAKGSSVSKGESLKDTAQTLEAMGVDAVVIRHGASGAPYRLANSGWIDAAVINAGDGTHQHPTQSLLDAFTMRRRLIGRDAGLGQDLDGRRITVVGDVLHSRVARSNVDLLHTLGADVTLVAPPTLVPVGVGTWPCEVSYDLDSTLPKSDAVMMLRVQRERMNAAFFPTEREYARRYGLDGQRMARMPEHAVVMHPGPMNRGMEITAEVADSPRCTAVEQVASGELTAPGAEVVRADGRILLPGLVDLHTHLREPGREDSETVLTGTRAAAKGGYTAVFAMANTFPVADTAGVVEQVWRLGREHGYCDVQPIGAVTVGLEGKKLAELGAMHESAAGVTVFSDDGKCVDDAVIMRRALEYVKAFGGGVAP